MPDAGRNRQLGGLVAAGIEVAHPRDVGTLGREQLRFKRERAVLLSSLLILAPLLGMAFFFVSRPA